MPEVIDAPAVPAAAPVAPAPTGIKAAMANFGELTTPKPVEKPVEPAKPDAPKTEPKPAAPAKPVKPADIWEKADPKLKNEHFKTKRELEEKVTGYEKRIKEIEAKPKEAPGDAKAIEAFQKQIKDYEQKLAAADYRQSQDFQKQYVAKWDAEYKATVKEIQQLTLTYKDGNGDDKSRQATEADFQKIMALPPGEQDRVIQELFGHYGNRVFASIKDLQRIERSANQAVAEQAANADTRAAEARSATENAQKHYDKLLKDSTDEMAREWPEHFAPDEKDAEASTALEKGYEFVDTALKNSASMTPEDLAAHNAVIRGRAAGFMRAVLVNNRLKTELESLKTELAKFRKSDPGGETEVRGEAAKVDGEVPAGILAAAKAAAAGSM